MINKHQKNFTWKNTTWAECFLKGILKDDLAAMLTVTITSKDKAWTRIGFEKESIQIQNIKKPYSTGKKCLPQRTEFDPQNSHCRRKTNSQKLLPDLQMCHGTTVLGEGIYAHSLINVFF